MIVLAILPTAPKRRASSCARAPRTVLRASELLLTMPLRPPSGLRRLPSFLPSWLARAKAPAGAGEAGTAAGPGSGEEEVLLKLASSPPASDPPKTGAYFNQKSCEEKMEKALQDPRVQWLLEALKVRARARRAAAPCSASSSDQKTICSRIRQNGYGALGSMVVAPLFCCRRRDVSSHPSMLSTATTERGAPSALSAG